ncbi:protein mono-ADP-ribosyltransferase PARP14-like [Haliotis asinina]|uniref:protein mono-ADP-ribosyltransferase PARP14-like n=1 Tax=Haliotis asinina TaxID=109174 RepID=UPI0035324BFC
MEDKIVHTFPFTDPTKVKYLKRVSIEGQLKDMQLEVKLYVDENQIQVVGAKSSVSVTEGVIEDILAGTDLYHITVTDSSRIRRLQTDETSRYVGSKLSQTGLQAVYHTCNDNINVRCKRGEFERVRGIIDSVIVRENGGNADVKPQVVNGGSQDSPNANGDKAVLYSERIKLNTPGIENIMRSHRFQALGEETTYGQNTKVASCHVNEEHGSISIMEGKLEDIGFKVDVIVCAASRDLNLSNGVVAKALSEAAGPDLQKRCEDRFKVEEMRKNSMTVLPPYRLKCNSVLFVCLPHWNKRQETDRKEKYQELLNKCLERISEMEPVPSSVALPALGCGNIKFPHQLVADLMMDTLKQYIRTHQVDIYVILPPEMQDLRQTFQTRREGFQIGDIRLTVRQGDILEENTDAIVHSISEDQSLTGTLSTKLVERFGEKFEADFANNRSTLQKTGLSFCTNCKPWTRIVNLSARVFKGKNESYWAKALLSCLKTTWKKFKPASLAFTCFGAGSRLSPEQVSEFLYDAIQQYHACSYKEKHVKDIRLIVLHEEEFDQVVHALSDIQKRESKRREAMGHEQAYELCVTSTDESRVQDFVEKIRAFLCANVRSEVVVDDGLVPALPVGKLDDLQDLAKEHMVGVKITGSRLLLYGMAEDIVRSTHDVKTFFTTCHSARWTSDERKTDDHLEIESISGYIEDAYQNNRRYTLFKSQSNKEYRVKVKDRKVTIRLLSERREIRVYRRTSITYDDIPSTWTPQRDKVVDTVPVEGEELENVTSLFHAKRQSTSENIDIKQVHRIQNPLLHKKYRAEEERLHIQNGWDNINERILWHGTSKDAVDKINRNGFDRSYSGKNNTKFGAGTYFSVDPSYSSKDIYSPPDSNGLKYVYQAKVLTGYPVEGNPAMIYLPMRVGNTPYDSAVNNVKAIDAYVIFKDDQAYPQYLIAFTDSTNRTASSRTRDSCKSVTE